MKSILLLLSIILASCATIDSNRIAPGYAEAFTSIKQLILGVENNIPPEVIQNIPYASMLVKIGRGPSALMILESVSDEKYTWVSADGVSLVIKNGIIIKTYGLPNNLIEKIHVDLNWENLYEKKELISYNSFNKPSLNNLKVKSIFKEKDYEEVKLTFETKNLRSIEERIASQEIGWYKTNKYWIDESNFIWKSVQNISPRLPEIIIEVTKKPQ